MSTNPSFGSKTIRIDVLPRLGGVDRRVGAAAPDGTDVGKLASPIRPEEFLRFFQNAYDATLITDEKGVFVIANRRVTDVLGYAGDDLRGVAFWQLISGAEAALVETVRESLASERFIRLSAWCVRKDGSAFPAVVAVNRFVSDDRLFFCFFIRDETLRTQAEDQLRTVQNAAKNAGTGVAVAGLDGALLYANPAMAALCGEESAEKILGRNLGALFGDGELVQVMMDAVQGGKNALVEVPLRQPDGKERWVQTSAAPNLDGEGALIGMVLSLVDTSDRRRAEQAERVVERDRVMMESLGAVCHHLGQPATVLLSSLEMLHRLQTRDPAMTAELLDMSLSAAETLRKTLQELNDLRHYHAEPYPGPSADRAAHIVAVQSPPETSIEGCFR